MTVILIEINLIHAMMSHMVSKQYTAITLFCYCLLLFRKIMFSKIQLVMIPFTINLGNFNPDIISGRTIKQKHLSKTAMFRQLVFLTREL